MGKREGWTKERKKRDRINRRQREGVKVTERKKMKIEAGRGKERGNISPRDHRRNIYHGGHEAKRGEGKAQEKSEAANGKGGRRRRVGGGGGGE